MSLERTPLGFTPDSREVLFSAQRDAARSNIAFPARSMAEHCKVGIDGGRRRMIYED